ncbi:MAG: hypothetical protein IH602_02410 [Bryobacteraceae bacterium]|nr:hypothetical protein [Bryobacteraceae bacterium]
MAFCPNCGAQVNGSFCGNCGATMSAGPAPGSEQQQQQQQYQQPQYQQPQYQQQAQAGGLSQNAASALCYLLGFITGIIFLVMAPYNTDPKVKYHAWQSIGFNVAYIALWFILTILTTLTGGILGLILVPIGLLISLCVFALWLFMMYKAYQGEGLHLPMIGDFAKKQAGLV